MDIISCRSILTVHFLISLSITKIFCNDEITVLMSSYISNQRSTIFSQKNLTKNKFKLFT